MNDLQKYIKENYIQRKGIEKIVDRANNLQYYFSVNEIVRELEELLDNETIICEE